MAIRVLITGITGFVGSHLAKYALAQGTEVYGSVRWRSKTENIDHIKDQIHLIECDLKDLSSTNALLQKAQPDYIFHLAAQSFVPTSWHAPVETLQTNIICQVNLFEAVRLNHTDPMIHIAGSSEEYGLVYPDELPIKETNPLRPLSPYGVSKVAQDLLGFQYHQTYGLKIIRTRAFNHTGPRQGEVFVCSNFAKQIAQIEKNYSMTRSLNGSMTDCIWVGNLEAMRDFSDVRDIVRAYWLALQKGEPGEVYNIASGTSRKIKEVLDILLNFSENSIRVKEDPARMRPSDVMVLKGDSQKFSEKVGWRPQIPFEKTLEDTLNYWRERLAAPKGVVMAGRK